MLTGPPRRAPVEAGPEPLWYPQTARRPLASPVSHGCTRAVRSGGQHLSDRPGRRGAVRPRHHVRAGDRDHVDGERRRLVRRADPVVPPTDDEHGAPHRFQCPVQSVRPSPIHRPQHRGRAGGGVLPNEGGHLARVFLQAVAHHLAQRRGHVEARGPSSGPPGPARPRGPALAGRRAPHLTAGRVADQHGRRASSSRATASSAKAAGRRSVHPPGRPKAGSVRTASAGRPSCGRVGAQDRWASLSPGTTCMRATCGTPSVARVKSGRRRAPCRGW